MHRYAISVTPRSRHNQEDSFLRQTAEGFFLEKYRLLKFGLTLDEARHERLSADNPGHKAHVLAVNGIWTKVIAQLNLAKESQLSPADARLKFGRVYCLCPVIRNPCGNGFVCGFSASFLRGFRPILEPEITAT